MTKPYRLFDEINATNHACIHSLHACPFCIGKLHKKDERAPDLDTIYIAPFEVVVHNRPDDIWVSFLGKVYDLTELILQYKDDKCILPLLAFAGKDLSHWFNEETNELRHYIHPITGASIPYCPHGPIPQVGPQVPTTKWTPIDTDKPWWVSDTFMIGYLTKRVRPVRIQNMQTRNICAINVCMEDQLTRILQRFLTFNTDADSYTWCYEDRVLDMDKTLDENGIQDERDKFTSIGLPENTYVPMLLLYYNDDMKWV